MPGDITPAEGLRVLTAAKPVYIMPNPAVAEDVLIPALRTCESFDLMVAYFSASVLREMAPGLASYLTRNDRPMRLLISPLLPDSDQLAIREGQDLEKLASDAIEAVFQDEETLRSALAEHTRRCLSYLLATQRLQMKAVIMKGGEFHPKQWVFVEGSDTAILSGSANATQRAVTQNVEQLRLDLSWKGEDAADSCRALRHFFESYWNNEHPNVAIAVDVSEAAAEGLLKTYGSGEPPTEDDYRRAAEIDRRRQPPPIGTEPRPPSPGFTVPDGLVWETGPYRHQGDAVKAWEANGDRGVLAIATGGGKTISSLIAANRLATRSPRLFVLVSAPTRPLVSQWAKEMRDFGLNPYVPADNRTMQENAARIGQRMYAVERGIHHVDSAVVTNQLLNSPHMRRLLERHGDSVLLIGDEVHNLGSEQGVTQLPPVAFRMGLSATPRSQYDPDRDEDIFGYFGDVVFDFPLEQAIGLCLVPYKYYVHETHLTSHEMETYRDLSDKIRLQYARLGDQAESSTYLQTLLTRRRELLEAADSKIDALRHALTASAPASIRHTLVYATDKGPEQLRQVNSLLRNLGIRFHQLTQEETGNERLVSEILARFRAGDIQVLTAKRVLDEGFNIPEISTAYLLASTTMERQWTQRRGRILRLCPAIGKTEATLHDIIALPPPNEGLDADSQRLVKGELKRVTEFARLSANAFARDGAYAWIREAQLEYRVWMD